MSSPLTCPYHLPLFWFFFYPSDIWGSTPVLLFSFGSSCSSNISTCFASPCQFVYMFCNPRTILKLVQTISVQPNFLPFPSLYLVNLTKYSAWCFALVLCFYSACGRTNDTQSCRKQDRCWQMISYIKSADINVTYKCLCKKKPKPPQTKKPWPGRMNLHLIRTLHANFDAKKYISKPPKLNRKFLTLLIVWTTLSRVTIVS